MPMMTHLQHSRAAFGTAAAPQQIVAVAGCNRFEINITLWGEGDLKQNGIEIARVEKGESRLRVFLELMKVVDMRIDTKRSDKADRTQESVAKPAVRPGSGIYLSSPF